MPTPYVTTTPTAATRPSGRPPLRRSATDRWIFGVCGGLAEHLGVRSRTVRWVAVGLGLLGGASLPPYLFLRALMPAPDGVPTRDGDRGERPWGLLILGGIVALGAGAAAVAQDAGIVSSVDPLLPLLLAAAGVVLAWSQIDETRREDWVGGGRFLWPRIGLGLALAVVGILVFATRGQSVTAIWDALLAAFAVVAGILFIAAPWVVRFWRDLRHEQVRAAREAERADIAAHLHDSVLQTLALIQRRSEDPTAVSRLARAQERELRTYLYAAPAGSADRLAAAMTQVAHDVEDLHGVAVDLVVTGDRPLEPHGQAAVQAFREALLNAVRHGAPPVTAYVEIGRDGVEAFVRDRGPGFDLDEVPHDRLGVRGSILARMERHGGSATVRRREDGTEVELRLPPLEGEAP